ncbi:MAG: hypothetical protein ACYS9C_13755 [Planctomycetota bacterium]
MTFSTAVVLVTSVPPVRWDRYHNMPPTNEPTTKETMIRRISGVLKYHRRNRFMRNYVPSFLPLIRPIAQFSPVKATTIMKPAVNGHNARFASSPITPVIFGTTGLLRHSSLLRLVVARPYETGRLRIENCIYKVGVVYYRR